MSKQLIDTLESKVFSAVDTIETLRSEINELKEERKILEDKLEELIAKMGSLEQDAPETPESDSAPAATPISPFGAPINPIRDESGY